jgi:DNA (cytosine-5)-methyltransferase 1
MFFSNQRELRFASLFCGCGGLDLGFIRRGFICVGAYDIDSYMVKLNKFNLGTPAEVCDIRREPLTISKLTHLDLLIAGSPCQGFSTAGKRLFDDPRNGLLVTAGIIARQLRPKVFVVENVKGVLSGKHKQYWDTLKYTMLSSGYYVTEFVLDEENVEIAQTRKRIVMLCWRTGKIPSFVLPKSRLLVLSDVLGEIEGKPNHNKRILDRESMQYKIAKQIKPGQKLSNVRGGLRAVHTWNIPEVFPEVSNYERAFLEKVMSLRRRYRVRESGDADPVPLKLLATEFKQDVSSLILSLMAKGYIRTKAQGIDLSNSFNGKYRRLAWDRPSLTVDTRFGDPKYFLHPDEHRGFTVREAARIQGFPDDYLFNGNEKESYRAIGNAVPPPMAEKISVLVERVLD